MSKIILPLLSVAVSVAFLRWAWVSANRPPTEVRLVKEVNPYDEDDWDWVPEDATDALQQL